MRLAKRFSFFFLRTAFSKGFGSTRHLSRDRKTKTTKNKEQRTDNKEQTQRKGGHQGQALYTGTQNKTYHKAKTKQ